MEHAQTDFPMEQEESGGRNARLACMSMACPRLGSLPLLPMNWQMDVPQLGVNHENRDNPRGCPTCLDLSPQTLCLL